MVEIIDYIEKTVDRETKEIFLGRPIADMGRLIAVDVSTMENFTYEVGIYDRRLGEAAQYRVVASFSNSPTTPPVLPRWTAPINIRQNGNGQDTAFYVGVLNLGAVNTVGVTVYWDDE